jgi:hypothetical protein
MIKAIHRLTIAALLLITLVIIAGCGGGTGGGTNLTITLSGLSSSTIEPGTTASGTIKLTASSVALNDVSVSIMTDASEVTGSALESNLSGNASFFLTAASNVSVKKTVKVWAEYGGVKSNVLQVSLNSVAESSTFNFTVSPTADFEINAAPGTSPGTGDIVVSGNQVEFKGPNGVIVTAPVELTIYYIDSWFIGDNVRVYGTDFNGERPVGSTTVNMINSIAQIPTTITVVFPPAPASGSISHVFNVFWRAKINYNGLDYIKEGSTLVTGTTTAE